jgi:hypothetical protein
MRIPPGIHYCPLVSPPSLLDLVEAVGGGGTTKAVAHLGVIDDKLRRRLKISRAATACRLVDSCADHGEFAGWWPPCEEEGYCRLSIVNESKP